MNTVILKRHKFKFYLAIILGTLAFVAIATVMLLVYLDIQRHKPLKPKDKLMPFISIAFYLFAIYTLYKYFKNAPIVKADQNFISIGRETFSWTDISHVELTGKRFFPYIISYPMECAALHFNNGQTKCLFDDAYENSWELKSFIKNVIADKSDLSEECFKPAFFSTKDDGDFETFSGNQFTSFIGILFWSMILFFVYIGISLNKGNAKHVFEATAFLLLFATVMILLVSRMMYYFKISNEYLLVRNQNFFWVKTFYRLSDISEVVFETPPKTPNCLRVITNDFKTKLYPASPLRNKTWLAMKDKLERCNIIVRNESI